MNHSVVHRLFIALVLAPAILTVGCAAPEAPGVRGRWKPVNHFAAAPEVIPLQQAYLFQASPADGTLKNMLSRWARDSRMSLSYLHSNDYTLYAPVADIHTTNLQAAVSALTDAYAQQGVSITADGSQIVVRAATAASAELED
ncbi:hypothetical protein FKV23_15635 [Lysobacter alkalisoli]|uniref:Toxin co-regulated pilus biosynthesis protein Q C-terminal domain-containing protein n=1 Tax=Marilutibacter alkalisoli TaxID=2591633 RepID=A0A514BVC6_9GAMM|nr:hypothetical protein FKV23_15635 [Lysobacter alkalisoli]